MMDLEYGEVDATCESLKRTYTPPRQLAAPIRKLGLHATKAYPRLDSSSSSRFQAKSKEISSGEGFFKGETDSSVASRERESSANRLSNRGAPSSYAGMLYLVSGQGIQGKLIHPGTFRPVGLCLERSSPTICFHYHQQYVSKT